MLVYQLTIFISAILLFLIQPLIGNVILPWFGGSSAVWSVAMLFFQLLLVVGYAYGHVLVRRLDHRRQGWVHLGLLIVSLLVLGFNFIVWPTAITPGARWAPVPGQAPLARVLLTLAVSVGLPYLVLSTTSPLMQAWFAARYPDRNPYPLYALSNAGSILALLGYPLLLQPLLGIHGQANAWTAGYLAFAVGLLVVARSVLDRVRRQPLLQPQEPVEPAARSRGQARGRWPLWLGFSMVGSVLLLGTTNEITDNVMALPMLWVGPLIIYLLTFVIVFSGKRGYSRWVLVLFLVATQLFGSVFSRGNADALVLQLAVYGVTLFAGCMVSHGELARLRPEAGELTRFYFMLALGGALGGAFVNIVAPALFRGTLEYPLALLACWVLAALAVALDKRSPIAKRQMLQLVVFLFFLVGILTSTYLVRMSVVGFNASTVASERNFYGILRVRNAALGDPSHAIYEMVHDTTIHGVQYVEPDLRNRPTAYYGETSGVGRAIRTVEARGGPIRVGVLGLGAGTIASYGRPGDVIRFYEIDPAVIRYAEGEGGYFSFLADAAGEIDIVAGDARLSLAHELATGGSQDYDLLAVDVFSGDAPPVHMLTLEALDLYLAHLTDDGLLAIHISTTHLDLVTLLAVEAQQLGLHGIIVNDLGDDAGSFPSQWVVMSRNPTALTGGGFGDAPDLATQFDPAVRPWTDSYSNLLQVITR